MEVYAGVICQPYLSGYKKKLYLYADILLGPFAKKTDVMASSHWSVLWAISIPPLTHSWRLNAKHPRAHPCGLDEEASQVAYSTDLHLNSNMLLSNRVYKCIVFLPPFFSAPSFLFSFNPAGFRILEIRYMKTYYLPKKEKLTRFLALAF